MTMRPILVLQFLLAFLPLSGWTRPETLMLGGDF